MEEHKTPITRLAGFLHRHLLGLLIAAYALAGFAPAAGLWLRSAHLGSAMIAGERLTAYLPSLLLAMLLFNAGLSVETNYLGEMASKPRVLAVGLLANLAVPLLF